MRVHDDVWAGSYDGKLFAWGVGHGNESFPSCKILHSDTDGLKVMVSIRNRLVMTGHRSGKVKIWSLEGCLQSSACGKSSVKSAVMAGDYAWTGHADGKIRLWSFSDGGIQLFRKIKAHKTSVMAMVSDLEAVWSATRNGTIRQWKTRMVEHVTEGAGSKSKTSATGPDASLGFVSTRS